MSNTQRKDTETRCTTPPYDPWEKEEGADAVSLRIGTFPDDLPQLSDYLTITDSSEQNPG